jgi:hypothetical protein
MADDVYWRVIHETPDKQIRLVVNEFREVEYLHLREYYLDFEEEWLPSNKGVSMPITLENTKELFAGLLEILSLAESKALIHETFKELIEETYQ